MGPNDFRQMVCINKKLAYAERPAKLKVVLEDRLAHITDHRLRDIVHGTLEAFAFARGQEDCLQDSTSGIRNKKLETRDERDII